MSDVKSRLNAILKGTEFEENMKGCKRWGSDRNKMQYCNVASMKVVQPEAIRKQIEVTFPPFII
jgi:hypothetical protein